MTINGLTINFERRKQIGYGGSGIFLLRMKGFSLSLDEETFHVGFETCGLWRTSAMGSCLLHLLCRLRGLSQFVGLQRTV